MLFLGKYGSAVMVGERFVSIVGASDELRKHVVARGSERSAVLQEFSFADIPDDWSEYLGHPAFLPAKDIYLLEDVCIGPRTGVVWVPDCGVIRESVSNAQFFYLHGVQDTMIRPRVLKESHPVCAFSTTVYFHALVEDLLRVLECRRRYSEAKVLVANIRPKYVDDLLAFVGVAKSDIIVCERPVRVSKCAFVPKWSDPGEIHRDDLRLLRETLLSNLHATSTSKSIYISRAHCSNRSLAGERALENELKRLGFRICYFEEMSFEEQLAAVRGADTIVAPHGSGLSNLVVAKSGTHVIEMISPNWVVPCFARMANLLGLDYHCIRTDPFADGKFSVPEQQVVALVTKLTVSQGV